MNQYSTEPEYSLAESEEIQRMAKHPSSSNIDYLALVADMQVLSAQLTNLVDTCGVIDASIKDLVSLLQELQ